MGSAVRERSLVWPKDLRCKCLVKFRRFEGDCRLHGEGVVLYGPRTHSIGVWFGFEDLWVLVGYTVKVWSLIWPKGSRCR